MRRFLACVIILLLLTGLTACGKSPEQQWQEQYDLGVKYVSEGNYEEAIIAFTAAIEIDPNNADAYIGRGDAYLALGETAENLAAAQADYAKAAKLNGAEGQESAGTDKIASAYEKLADASIAGEDWAGAVEILQQELEACGQTESLMAKLEELGLMIGEDGTIQPDYYASQKFRNALNDLRFAGYEQNYYLTDAQREEVLRPLVSKVRYFYEYGDMMAPGAEWSDQPQEYGERLAGLYYVLGDLDQARQVREELFRQTGEEYLNPDGYEEQYSSSVGYYNGYGARVQEIGDSWENVYEYDDAGKPLSFLSSSANGYPDSLDENFYENGRIVKTVNHGYLGHGRSDGSFVYEPATAWRDYEYGDGQVIMYNYDTDGVLAQKGIMTLNEYGFEEETQWEDMY